MALSSSELKEGISKILSRSETTSAKIILTELEKAFETDFTSRKEEIGKLVKEILVENATAETIFYKQMAEKNPQNLIKEWHNSVDNGNYSQSRVHYIEFLSITAVISCVRSCNLTVNND